MAGITLRYKFTNKDTDVIVSLGYSFNGITENSFPEFMQKNYPGFELAHLLEQVEQLMVPNAITKVTRQINVDQDTLHVVLENIYKSEDDALIFDRKFYRESSVLKVSHNYLVFPIAARNKGLSKKVLKASLDQYLKMGVKIVEVIAGLSKGAYVWARHGFVAVNPLEMKRILKRAEHLLTTEEYGIVKIIFDDYYKNPNGDAFPIRRWADLPFMKKVLMDPKSQWHGRLDLENKEQLRKFEEYVSEQKK